MEVKLSKYVDMLDHVRQSTVSSEHGIRLKNVEDREYHNSIPTYFIYSFFAFNSIYSVDWRKTMNDQAVVVFSDKSERTCINRLLDFCFKNAKPKDIDDLSQGIRRQWQEMGFSSESINRVLESIKLDDSARGNVRKEEILVGGDVETIDPVKEFKKAVRNILKTPCLTCEEDYKKDYKDIAQFVYSIRCNIFHGLKDVCQLLKPNTALAVELKKLELYTTLLDGLNYFCIDQIRHTMYLRGRPF